MSRSAMTSERNVIAGRNDIELVATNSAGTSSYKSTFVEASFDTLENVEDTMEKPRNLNVLAIGISGYESSRHDFTDLPPAANDARVFAQTAQAQANGKLYAETRVKLLTDAEATRSACLDSFFRRGLRSATAGWYGLNYVNGSRAGSSGML